MNIDKSKILIFSKGRQTGELQFRYDDKSIETVTNFNYLGITLSRTGSFKLQCINYLKKQKIRSFKKGKTA